MRPSLVLAIDQGTTNSKALLVTADGQVVAQAAHALAPIVTPRPGWFEQDAEDLWQATLAAVSACLALLPAAGRNAVAGLAITNQRESVVAWRRSSGQPVSSVLGWQDARTADFCQRLAQTGAGESVPAKTGLPLDPMFSGPKLRWLFDELTGPLDDICLGTIDAYLIARLSGRCATEAGNASRSLLFDLHSLDWDDELLDLFGLPRTVLPPVLASDADYGTTTVAGLLPDAVPILAVLGDSHAALYGHCLTQPGAGKVTYGTGSSVMVPLGDAMDGLGDFPAAVSTTLAWRTAQPGYAREGNIIATGAALDALAGWLRLGDVGALLALASDELGMTPAQCPGLSYVPAFAGLGAPYWDRQALGLLAGLGRTTSAAEVAWAGLDAVAQQVCDVIDAIHAAGDRLDAIWADGGLTTSPALMQLQADLVGLPVQVSAVAQASALGVARLAWQRIDPTGALPMQPARVYRPERSADWRAIERARWQDAVARARGQAVAEPAKGWQEG